MANDKVVISVIVLFKYIITMFGIEGVTERTQDNVKSPLAPISRLGQFFVVQYAEILVPR